MGLGEAMGPPYPGTLDPEALTVAMAVAPGVYSRNRFFHLHKTPEVRRARARAALVRGIVQHLVMLARDGVAPGAALVFSRGGGRVTLSYRVPAMHLERRTDLTELEASCILCLAERAGLAGLAPTQADREVLRAALRRLSIVDPILR